MKIQLFHEILVTWVRKHSRAKWSDAINGKNARSPKWEFPHQREWMGVHTSEPETVKNLESFFKRIESPVTFPPLIYFSPFLEKVLSAAPSKKLSNQRPPVYLSSYRLCEKVQRKILPKKFFFPVQLHILLQRKAKILWESVKIYLESLYENDLSKSTIGKRYDQSANGKLSEFLISEFTPNDYNLFSKTFFLLNRSSSLALKSRRKMKIHVQGLLPQEKTK